MVKKLTALLYALPLLFAAKTQAVSIDMPTSFADFSSQDVKTTIQNLIRIVVGFLGIIVILIILWGGFRWMTSFGDEDKISESKKLISAGVIGLIILLAAFAVATFVVNSLSNAV